MLGDSSGVGAIFKPFDRICAKAERLKHCLEWSFFAHINHVLDWFAHFGVME
jgi:hypothetical protein